MKNKVFLLNVALIAVLFATLSFTSCGGGCTYKNDPVCFCQENPNDERCKGECTFEADPVCFCKANPNDERCCTWELNAKCFCEENPGDPRCADLCAYEIDPVCFCAKEENKDDPRCGCPTPKPAGLPADIAAGSNFYIFLMDEVCQDWLICSNKVKIGQMMRNFWVYNDGETLNGQAGVGPGAFGEMGWTSWIANDYGWCGGAIVTNLDIGFDRAPDLSPIFDGGYYFHFAVKAPTNQPNTGIQFELGGELGGNVSFYVGSQAPTGVINLGNFAHDGEWHHFDIPVSQLTGYLWTGPMTGSGEISILGFLGVPFSPGMELNMDAIFFYKK